jgi:preprotein translocase subunit SecA
MDRIDEEILRWIFLYQPVVRDGETGEEPPPVARPPQAAPAVPPQAPPRAAPPGLAGARPLPRNLTFNNPTDAPSAFAKAEPKEAKGGSDEVQTIKREGKKVGRNDLCPCGSGKKYKKCHGTN